MQTFIAGTFVKEYAKVILPSYHRLFSQPI